MKSKRSEQSKKRLGITDWLGILLLIALPSWFTLKMVKAYKVTGILANGENKKIVAKIIRTKVYLGNSPVTQEFYYKYEFTLNGKKYNGDSQDSRKMPGDTILVKYNVSDPDINQPSN